MDRSRVEAVTGRNLGTAPGWLSSVIASCIPVALLWALDAPSWALAGVGYTAFLIFRLGDQLRHSSCPPP